MIAGADGVVAARLALAMLGLQFAIGTANDLADTARDRIGHPWKPIPAGLVRTRAAQIVFTLCAGSGMALAASVRVESLAVGAIGLADGLLYDLRLKGTPMSWLPFAAGVALLPVFAWVGATGSLPVVFFGIVPMALLAGAILATTNALADLESDRAADTASVATKLGRRRTLALNGLLLIALQVIAGVTSVAAKTSFAWLLAELAGAALGGLGFWLARSRDEHTARLAWEIQALGILVTGVGWLAGLASVGLLSGR